MYAALVNKETMQTNLLKMFFFVLFLLENVSLIPFGERCLEYWSMERRREEKRREEKSAIFFHLSIIIIYLFIFILKLIIIFWYIFNFFCIDVRTYVRWNLVMFLSAWFALIGGSGGRVGIWFGNKWRKKKKNDVFFFNLGSAHAPHAIFLLLPNDQRDKICRDPGWQQSLWASECASLTCQPHV